MSLFSSIYAERDAEVRGILHGVRCPSPQRTEEILARSQSSDSELHAVPSTSDALSLCELAELLQIGVTAGADQQFEMLRAHTRKLWRATAGNTLRYVSPIYVSSFCVDACPYCNFSALRKDTVRHRLSLAELDREIELVLSRDARVIELVYATDPEYDTALLVRDVSRAVKAVENLEGGGVLLCTEYLPSHTYEALADAGLRGIVQWDETLDQQAYARWHSASPRKANFHARIDNHDRALAAGLDVACGALFGLADFRYDALMQVVRARYFAEAYGRGPFVMGTARLKPIAGNQLHLATSVSDRAHETALMVYKIALPQTGRWLQTRETFELNLRNLLDGDVFTYSCGDVQPGGYTQINTTSIAGAQFGVNELERTFVDDELAKQCFQINYGWMSPAKARALASR
jgi:2-iminoacetate synthase